MKDATNDKKCHDLVIQYFEQKQAFDEHEKEFKEAKKEFEDTMTEYLESMGKKKIVVEVPELGNGVITAQMIEKTQIDWFPEKLEKRVTKPVAKQVIKKQYSIADMKGLVQYLKSCGVDPKIFAKYLSIDKTVDQDAVERLGELGKITPKNISGCYLVRCSKPYFRLTMKKGEDNGENEQ